MRDTDLTSSRTAELAWELRLHDAAKLTTPADARRLLDPLLPPPLRARYTIVDWTRGGRRTAAQLNPPHNGRYRLQVAFPESAITILHEGAHLIVEHSEGWDKTPGHGKLFRQTLLWLVHCHYGPKEADRLRAAYEEKGLHQ